MQRRPSAADARPESARRALRAYAACASLGVLALAATGCRKGSALPGEKSLEPMNDGATTRVADAAVAEALATSPFVVVAHSGHVRVCRITDSPALAIDHEANVVWELDRSGTVRLIEPLAERVTMIERAPFRIGGVAGRWPIVQVEFGAPSGPDSYAVHNWAVDTSKGTAERTKIPYGHVETSSPWSDGIELGWASGGSSLYESGMSAMNGDFIVLAGPTHPLPKAPKELRALTPFVAAYDSGRVFLLGDVKPQGDEHYGEVVWSFQGRDAKPMALPGAATHMVRGRREEETLVAGKREGDRPFLARFGGAAWIDVPIAFPGLVRVMATSDEGSVWIISGPQALDARGGGEGELWRASFPELQFTRVPLPPMLVPTSVTATSEHDVWLVATDPSSTDGTSLLHTQSARVPSVPVLPREPGELARTWYARRGPAPFTPACAFPFLALGRETELGDADVKDFALTSDPSWYVPGVLVRAPSGEKLFGFELGDDTRAARRDEVAAYTNLVAKARVRWSGAELVCGRLPIERTIDVARPRPRHPPPPNRR